MRPKLVIDRTGIEKYELLLNDHLNGNLPSDVIRVRGGTMDTSIIRPPK